MLAMLPGSVTIQDSLSESGAVEGAQVIQRPAPSPIEEAETEASRNKKRNSDPSNEQKTTRPGVIRTHDQGIMSPLL
jgi:hypothetical protein